MYTLNSKNIILEHTKQGPIKSKWQHMSKCHMSNGKMILAVYISIKYNSLNIQKNSLRKPKSLKS